MKLYVASDHAGFELKEKLVAFLRGEGHEVEDCGAHAFAADDDYPDFVTPCAERVAAENTGGGAARAFGIILGASGQGEAMCANRVQGVRAAVYYGEPPHPQVDADGNQLDIIESARAHNDANILSLGARFVSESEARAAVQKFLATPFSNEPRHARRIAKF